MSQYLLSCSPFRMKMTMITSFWRLMRTVVAVTLGDSNSSSINSLAMAKTPCQRYPLKQWTPLWNTLILLVVCSKATQKNFPLIIQHRWMGDYKRSIQYRWQRKSFEERKRTICTHVWSALIIVNPMVFVESMDNLQLHWIILSTTYYLYHLVAIKIVINT